ncbi:hypothetical protein BGZ63DRAFT_52038 [Mariannaea sp. PMI_226]|nr:hypothetical protein BGZ63DRAFT_52038 [Mariannaea sp. PMI_226]
MQLQLFFIKALACLVSGSTNLRFVKNSKAISKHLTQRRKYEQAVQSLRCRNTISLFSDRCSFRTHF